jgi:fumarylacetoacetate (FAA) hydrolase family protein
MHHWLTPERALPDDRRRATLIGRAWLPDIAGPVVILVDGDDVVDVSGVASTSAELLNLPDPVAAIRASGPLPRLASLADVLRHSAPDGRAADVPWLLAPCDLQAVKASGVTFVASLLERVIEEQARGDAAKAEGLRRSILSVIGESLHDVRPGSPEAMRLKEVLIGQGIWSQYLEVGIGPDAEIFTKSQPMSSVGTGAEIGIHPKSEWNNPEPEIVLAVAAGGRAVGATLGNDVNLRDVEGRSALLLGKAKDNNASCAIGPFIRLFDEHFTMDDVRRADLALHIAGTDGFAFTGRSSMAEISRDPRTWSRRRSARTISTPTAWCCSSARCSRRCRRSVRARQGLHPCGRRRRHGRHADTRRARQSREPHRPDRAVDVRHAGADEAPRHTPTSSERGAVAPDPTIW